MATNNDRPTDSYLLGEMNAKLDVLVRGHDELKKETKEANAALRADVESKLKEQKVCVDNVEKRVHRLETWQTRTMIISGTVAAILLAVWGIIKVALPYLLKYLVG